MFGSSILEVAIGLVFLYILLGLICSVVNEWIARIVALRGVTLWAALKHLLNDPQAREVTKLLYEHPLVKGTETHTIFRFILWFWNLFTKFGPFPNSLHLPGYLSSRTFSQALLDILQSPGLDPAGESAQYLQKVIRALQEGQENNREVLQKNLEKWFDEAMERVSGWYKRSVQTITLVLGLVIASILNADSIMYAKFLWNNAPVREAVVKAADELVKKEEERTAKQPDKNDLSKSVASIKTFQKEIQDLGLPLGWVCGDDKDIRQCPTGWGWALKTLGLLLTGLALSLGAQFWFDALKGLNSIRSTGRPPEKA